MKRLVTLLFLICLSVAGHSQQWYPLGPDVNNQPSLGTVEGFDMALAPDGSKYVAFRDMTLGGELTVRKYNGTTWEAVGPAGISDGAIGDLAITVSHSGEPYVVFTELNNWQYPRIKKYDGTTWVDLGILQFPGGGGNMVQIETDTAGNVYAAYVDYANLRIHVANYTNGTWNMVGGYAVIIQDCYYLDMAMALDGTPYVAYGESSSTRTPTVRKWDGTAWTQVGATSLLGGDITAMQLEIDRQGQPVIAYRNGFYFGYSPEVKKYDGISWVNVGNFPAVNPTEELDLALDTAGNPTLSYSHGYYNYDSFGIQKYDGSVWQTLYDKPRGEFGRAIIEIDSSNTLYACYAENNYYYYNSYSYLRMAGWLPNGMQDMSGNKGIMDGVEYIEDLAADTAGNVYLVFHESNSFKLWHYNGNIWDTIAIAGVMSPFSRVCNITTDKAGVLHLVYADAAANNDITVKKYDGTNWVTLGITPASTQSDALAQLQFDTANVPYIALARSFTFDDSITVKKYDGTNWMNVGQNGFVTIGTFGRTTLLLIKVTTCT